MARSTAMVWPPDVDAERLVGDLRNLCAANVNGEARRWWNHEPPGDRRPAVLAKERHPDMRPSSLACGIREQNVTSCSPRRPPTRPSAETPVKRGFRLAEAVVRFVPLIRCPRPVLRPLDDDRHRWRSRVCRPRRDPPSTGSSISMLTVSRPFAGTCCDARHRRARFRQERERDVRPRHSTDSPRARTSRRTVRWRLPRGTNPSRAPARQPIHDPRPRAVRARSTSLARRHRDP